MIVVFSLMRRRDDVALEEFRRYWLDPHGPLVCRFPRLRQYTQNHVLETPASPLRDQLRTDGFAALGYDNDQDQEAATASPQMAACDVDSPQFIGGVLRVVTEARPVMPRPVSPEGMGKLITVFTGGGAATQPALAAFAAAAVGSDGITGFVEHRALRQRGPRSAVPVLAVTVDAIVETWFATPGLLARAFTGLQAAAGEQAVAYVVKEYRFR